jgi:hypothetical protein
MKRLSVFLIVLSSILFSRCTNEALQKEEKFSTAKKYAIIPFNCGDQELGLNVSIALKEWLEKYDYRIIEPAELDTLLIKSNLTKEKLINNYTLAVGKLKGVDGLIYGYIDLDKKTSNSAFGSSSSSVGGNRSFIAQCEAGVIDLKTGDPLVRGIYVAPTGSGVGGSKGAEDVGKFLSLQLSLH